MDASSRIRIAGPGDAADIARLLCGFRDWWGFDGPTDESMLASVERLLGDPHTEFLLAGESATGVCQLRYRHSAWTGTDDCWLEDLFVEDAARGEGLGGALVDAALARAAERGAARIGLDVADGNAAARALYESRGFERDAHLMKRLV